MNDERDTLERLKGHIREQVQGFEKIGDEELYNCIDEAILSEAERKYLPLTRRLEWKTRLYDSFRRLDILQQLVDDPEVTEIMVNGKDHIFVERQGRICRWEQGFDNAEQDRKSVV